MPHIKNFLKGTVNDREKFDALYGEVIGGGGRLTAVGKEGGAFKECLNRILTYCS
jgi:hypothetical protein